MDDILAEIRFFAFGFAPRGWALCAGQLLPISQNTLLFALLGTNYGGNGTTTFALPNLQSRVAVGWGWGPGLSNYDLAQQGGSENITLVANNIPAHTHAVTGTVTQKSYTGAGNTDTPYNSYPATSSYSTSSSGNPMAAMQYEVLVGNTGSSTPVSIIQPVLALTAGISLTGTFPSRN